MTDRRITPDPALSQTRVPGQVNTSVADLCRTPGGARDRQLLFGEHLTILGETEGWRYVQAAKDGYCGHLRGDALGPPSDATHLVQTRATHCYSAPNLKSPERRWLSHGSRVRVTDVSGTFAATDQGFIPKHHLIEITTPETDPAAVAERYLGTPYLWGGNSSAGIDCSGLVQAACLACGIPCPGDSDMQQRDLGRTVDPGTQPQRNDLLFWKGHVAWVWDAETLLHANAHSMSVAFEPLTTALRRIEDDGDGPVTGHKRL